MSKIIITHLYPNELNIYGDRGNIITLTKRLEWRGFKPVVEEVHVGRSYDFSKSDIVFGGGGQDKGQELVADDLQNRASDLQQAAANQVVMLGICGTYQLFGHWFKTLEGKHIPGIGLLNIETVGSKQRMIGNVVIDTPFGELIGFENHSGQTKLRANQEALGKVVQGFGNDGKSGQEGAISRNVFGTYLHGPILPKNPEFADELISRALRRHSPNAKLEPLNDTLEHQAAKVAKRRPR